MNRCVWWHFSSLSLTPCLPLFSIVYFHFSTMLRRNFSIFCLPSVTPYLRVNGAVVCACVRVRSTHHIFSRTIFSRSIVRCWPFVLARYFRVWNMVVENFHIFFLLLSCSHCVSVSMCVAPPTFIYVFLI